MTRTVDCSNENIKAFLRDTYRKNDVSHKKEAK